MENKVDELERRIEYLEKHLGTCHAKDKFARFVNRVFPDGTIDTINDGRYGYHARVEDIDGDDIQRGIDKMENNRIGVDFAVVETVNGPGMEVWTSPEF